MHNVLFFGYEFLSEFVPFSIVLMLFKQDYQKHGVLLSKQQYVFLVAFALYIIAVFHVTWAGTIYNAFTFQFQNMWDHINLVPFSNDINPLVYGLNVIMFIPFGFMVPLIWQKMRTLPYITVVGFLFSLLIELSQLLSRRGTDVDDLIMNTLGAVIGYLLHEIWSKVTKSKFQIYDIPSRELPIFIGAMYLGRFFLFNHLGLINLLYGN